MKSRFFLLKTASFLRRTLYLLNNSGEARKVKRSSARPEVAPYLMKPGARRPRHAGERIVHLPMMRPPLPLLRSYKTLFLWLLLFFLPLKGQGNAQTPASTTVKVTVGFEGFLLEQMISVPNLREKAIGEWVTPETQEVKESLANENPPVEDKPPSSFSPQGLPAAKNQPLKVPQTRSFPQPFTRGTPSSPSPPELSSTPPSKPKTRKEAIKAFLLRRPDIREFIERNTGIKDDLAILEKWVYDVMKSSDSDWAEAKDIIENYPDK